MKLQYNGQELECITEGYWPEGVTMISSAGHSVNGVICLQSSRILTNVGTTLQAARWAILPPKPAQRRLTNREVGELCKKGWDVHRVDEVGNSWLYMLVDEKEPCYASLNKLRAPGSDEWVEPTSDLLEDDE